LFGKCCLIPFAHILAMRSSVSFAARRWQQAVGISSHMQSPCRAAHSRALPWYGVGRHRCGQAESRRGSRASERRAVTCGTDSLSGQQAACHTGLAKATRPTKALIDTRTDAAALVVPGDDPMVYNR